VHVCYVIFPEGVPFVVEEPGFDAGDVRGQPLTVAEWYGRILAAMQQQHRDQYLGHLETPRGGLRHAVVPESLDPGRQGQLHSKCAKRLPAQDIGTAKLGLAQL
jgi:hypothetical protein